MIDCADRTHLAGALALARRGWRKTRPNPHVGCVIVREGRIVGAGFHARAGEPHAEPLALADAGEAARGATLYANMEPCCHQGRTPPCTRAILAAGVARVVVSHRDPNPLVNGQGFAELAAAGVIVEHGALVAEAVALNEPYLTSMARGRPMGILKAAQTLDGRIAAAAGESKWITSAWARDWARELRGEVDAVAVGIGTVLADDPDLRPAAGSRDGIWRVVLDATLRTPPAARMLRSAAEAPVLLLTTPAAPEERARALEAAGATIVRVASDDAGRVDLDAAAQVLASRGIQSVLYEGGGKIHGALLAAGLVDRVLLVLAPRALGGSGGTPVADRPGSVRLADAWEIPIRSVRRLGPDLLCEGDLTDLTALISGSARVTPAAKEG